MQYWIICYITFFRQYIQFLLEKQGPDFSKLLLDETMDDYSTYYYNPKHDLPDSYYRRPPSSYGGQKYIPPFPDGRSNYTHNPTAYPETRPVHRNLYSVEYYHHLENNHINNLLPTLRSVHFRGHEQSGIVHTDPRTWWR